MASQNFTVPNLPVAPEEYSKAYMDQLTNVLRLYFNQLNNPSPLSGATQINGSTIFSGLSFRQPNPSSPNTFVTSLPTQSDLSSLRVGDVYYDTTDSNTLKINT